MSSESGYGITFPEFERLLAEPECQDRILSIVDETGQSLANPAAVHRAIQEREDLRYRLYQLAMSLWR